MSLEKTETKARTMLESIPMRMVQGVLKGFSGLLLVGSLYASGYGIYNHNKSDPYKREISRLEKQKTELTQKMDEWQTYIPLMQNQEFTRFGKLLDDAIRDTTNINRRLEGLYETRRKINDKSVYSWAAFFMGERK